MVTRKPVPNDDGNTIHTNTHAAPYPTTPVEPVARQDFPAKDANKLTRRDSDGSIATNGTWDDSDEEEGGYVEVPQPLKIRPSSQDMQHGKRQEDGLPAALRPGGGQVYNEVPSALRPGPTGGHGMEGGNPWATAESSRNPFKQQSQQQQSRREEVSAESSQNVWDEGSASASQPSHVPPFPPSQAPPPPPSQPVQAAPPPPVENMSRMSVQDCRSSSYETAEVLNVPHKGMPPFSPVVPQSTGQSTDSSAFPSTNPWSGTEGHSAPSPGLPPKDPVPVSGTAVSQQPFHPPYPMEPDGAPVVRETNQHYPPPPGPPPPPQEQYQQSHLPQEQYQPPPPQLQHQSPTLPREQYQHTPTQPQTQSQHPPPTSSFDHGDAPINSTAVHHVQPDDSTRNELYQVKHIRWWDAASNSMRSSPILTQNANGPCPLLALVNAIVLSTPADLSTPLVDALSDNGNRSQISLGFLLDALFDELTSRRRGDTLPDVTELYAFLLALHTGMNVNPRFITPVITPRGSLDGHSSAINNIHPTDRSQSKAGAFEETKEMQLYSTLNIPLIHGWVPPPSSPAYAAFARSAQTFEEAQNIQFLEQDYLALPGLDDRQQQMLDDIRTIKQFLSNWPTQLTEYGLEAISKSLQPGQIAILFRNDHFSTLYKEPRGGALMTLVTDTGYTSHEEIVWESLVDVNGAAAEMFSGDFRTVTHGNGGERVGRNEQAGSVGQWEDAQTNYHGQDSGVVDASGRESEIAPPLPGPRPAGSGVAMSSTEQADHDFALALQLQEEEEDAQRQADERRRRERELSERFLSNQETPPAIPPRRGSGRRQASATAARGGRPAVSRPAGDTAGGEAPPPSYEQSRTDQIVTPGGRPTRPPGGATPAQAARPEVTMSGGQGNVAGRGRGGGARGGMRGGRGGGVGGAANVKDAEDKCVLM